MARTNITQVLAEGDALSADEQIQVRDRLNQLLAAATLKPKEEDLENRLIQSGFLRPTRLQPTVAKQYHQYKPIQVRGRPVSETLLADRR